MKKLLTLILLLTIAGYCALQVIPNLTQRYAQDILSDTLKTQVVVGDVVVDVFTSTVYINGATIKDYPSFSDRNMLEAKNIVINYDLLSLLSSPYRAENISIEKMNIKFNGGINENNIEKLNSVLIANDEHEKQHAKQAAKENHEGHHSPDFLIAADNFKIKEIKVEANITQPIRLGKKDILLDGLTIKNVGAEEGVTINSALMIFSKELDQAVDARLTEMYPPKKLFDKIFK